ncbi:MAG: DUF5131 family protein, partial [Paludibaculum sp.]
LVARCWWPGPSGNTIESEQHLDEDIDRILAVMSLCWQHRFIALTKRSERLHDYFESGEWWERVEAFQWDLIQEREPNNRRSDDIAASRLGGEDGSLPNVILGVSVENRAQLGRIDDLRETPAACRMVSFEPLLEDSGRVRRQRN